MYTTECFRLYYGHSPVACCWFSPYLRRALFCRERFIRLILEYENVLPAIVCYIRVTKCVFMCTTRVSVFNVEKHSNINSSSTSHSQEITRVFNENCLGGCMSYIALIQPIASSVERNDQQKWDTHKCTGINSFPFGVQIEQSSAFFNLLSLNLLPRLNGTDLEMLNSTMNAISGRYGIWPHIECCSSELNR